MSRLLAAAVAMWLVLGAGLLSGQEQSKEKDELQALLKQAAALQKEGKYAEALQAYEKAASMAEKVLGPDDPGTASALNSLALRYSERGQYGKAEPLYQRSLQIREAKLGKDHPDVAVSLNNLAGMHQALGQYGIAEPLFQRSLQIREAKLGKDHTDVAVSLNNLALLYNAQRQYDKAEPLFQRSLQIWEAKLGVDDSTVAICLNNLAGLYKEQNQYDKAEPLFQRSLRIWETRLGQDHPNVAVSLNNLARLYRAKSQDGKAEPLYQRSLQIWETKLGQGHPNVAMGLRNLADVYEDQGRYSKAESLRQRSLQIYETKFGKNHLDVAASLHNLANLYSNQGQYGRAEALYQRSLQIYEANLGKDHPKLVPSLNNLALVHEAQGRHGTAELLLLRSLQILERILGKDDPDVAAILNNIGAMCWRHGQYVKAEPFYQRSLQIWESKLGKDHPKVAVNINNLALLYQKQGQYSKAEPLYQRNLQILEAKLGKDAIETATGVNNLALLYKDQGEYDKAELLCLRSLQIKEAKLGKEHPEMATGLNTLAVLYASQNKWVEAAQTTEAMCRITCRHVDQNLSNLAAHEQLTFLKRDGLILRMALPLALARRSDKGMPERSAVWLLNSKALSQRAQAKPLLLARDADNRELSDLFRELIDTRKALATLTLAPPQPGQEVERFQRLAQLSQQEHGLARKLGQAIGHPLPDDPWVELDPVRQALPAGNVLVEVARFWLYDYKAKGREQKWLEPRYAAWVIPAAGAGQVQLIDLGAASKIETAVQELWKLLQAAPSAITDNGEAEAEQTMRQSLQSLAQMVLEPLLPYIGKSERWILSPDGALWLVPWAALPLKDGSYVIEKHHLHYVVTGRDLVQPPSPAKSAGALVLANPDFDLLPAQAVAEGQRLVKEAPVSVTLRGMTSMEQLPRFPRLPGTAAEAAAITPTLKRHLGIDPVVRTEKQALEAVFKTVKNPRILVLSTHGFFLADQVIKPSDHLSDEMKKTLLTEDGKPLENPLLRCGLALAGANQRQQITDVNAEDGILTGLEILGTDLRGTELVVLSACETGLGRVNVGEGVAGLRQAFQLAGARSVLASLWQVDDRETARLMIAFFDQLAKGKSKAEALREAQLAIIKARRERDGAAHPFYWAAFTLTGQDK